MDISHHPDFQLFQQGFYPDSSLAVFDVDYGLLLEFQKGEYQKFIDQLITGFNPIGQELFRQIVEDIFPEIIPSSEVRAGLDEIEEDVEVELNLTLSVSIGTTEDGDLIFRFQGRVSFLVFLPDLLSDDILWLARRAIALIISRMYLTVLFRVILGLADVDVQCNSLNAAGLPEFFIAYAGQDDFGKDR